MRIKKRRLFWIWNFDKEEVWLNRMAAQGWALVAVHAPRYEFEESAPGEYAVRLELLDNWPTTQESARYIGFVEDTGAEYIGSVLRWVYFRRKVAEGTFDLFSDIDSRIRHLNRMLLMIGVVDIALVPSVVNIWRHYFDAPRPINLFASIFCSAAFAFLAFGVVRLFLKRRKLKKARTLHE